MSGSYLGCDGDIVVDDLENWKHVFGIANGLGSIKEHISLE